MVVTCETGTGGAPSRVTVSVHEIAHFTARIEIGQVTWREYTPTRCHIDAEKNI